MIYLKITIKNCVQEWMYLIKIKKNQVMIFKISFKKMS